MPRGEGVGVPGGEQGDEALHRRVGPGPLDQGLHRHIGAQEPNGQRQQRRRPHLPGGPPAQQGQRQYDPQQPPVAQGGVELHQGVEPPLADRLLNPQQNGLVHGLYDFQHGFLGPPPLTPHAGADIISKEYQYLFLHGFNRVCVLYLLFPLRARAFWSVFS